MVGEVEIKQLIGAVCGWIAEIIMNSGHGLIINIILGLVGGVIFDILGLAINGIIGSIICGVVSSCLLIFIVKLTRK